MRVLIQRVKKGSVQIGESVVAKIGQGMVVMLGIGTEDSEEDAEWLIGKLARLRIFDDENGIMNLSVNDVDGEMIVVSQFTLHASTKKGNRPSYIRAARPEQAIPLYEYFLSECSKALGKPVQSGEFGADMQVDILNEGPVTIWIDSKARE